VYSKEVEEEEKSEAAEVHWDKTGLAIGLDLSYTKIDFLSPHLFPLFRLIARLCNFVAHSFLILSFEVMFDIIYVHPSSCLRLYISHQFRWQSAIEETAMFVICIVKIKY
jgi:hypothetical protein